MAAGKGKSSAFFAGSPIADSEPPPHEAHVRTGTRLRSQFRRMAPQYPSLLITHELACWPFGAALQRNRTWPTDAAQNRPEELARNRELRHPEPFSPCDADKRTSAELWSPPLALSNAKVDPSALSDTL